MQDLVTKIHAHAMENYSNGWDWIVECYPGQNVLTLLDEDMITFDAAIAELQEYVTLRHDQMEDVCSYGEY